MSNIEQIRIEGNNYADCGCSILNHPPGKCDRSPLPSPRNSILNEREKTHGSFDNVAGCAQDLKSTLRNRRLSSSTITETQVEALDMICTKMARIICGNPLEPDHWKDIAGYANLGEEACHDKK